MSLTKKEADELVSEVFDPRRITLYCPKHFYIGPRKDKPNLIPASGCTDCWRIFYIHELIECPPDKRREKLEEIEEVMANVVELVEKGQWDFVPYDHAQIEIGQE